MPRSPADIGLRGRDRRDHLRAAELIVAACRAVEAEERAREAREAREAGDRTLEVAWLAKRTPWPAKVAVVREVIAFTNPDRLRLGLTAGAVAQTLARWQRWWLPFVWLLADERESVTMPRRQVREIERKDPPELKLRGLAKRVPRSDRDRYRLAQVKARQEQEQAMRRAVVASLDEIFGKHPQLSSADQVGTCSPHDRDPVFMLLAVLQGAGKRIPFGRCAVCRQVFLALRDDALVCGRSCADWVLRDKADNGDHVAAVLLEKRRQAVRNCRERKRAPLARKREMR